MAKPNEILSEHSPGPADQGSTVEEEPRPARAGRLLHSSSKWVRLFWSLAVLVVLMVLWQLGTQLWSNPFFPTPLKIFSNLPSVLVDSGGRMAEHPLLTDVVTSVVRMVSGFVLGCVVGVLVGVLLGLFQRVRDYVFPVVEFLRSIPATAVLPIFILVLGLGSDMQVLFIAYGVTWFVLINTASGVSTMDPALMEFSRVFKVSRGKLIFGIVLPSASPQIFAGMRIGLTAAMILFVTSEFMGATNGIGFQLIYSQRYFQIVDMWSWMVIIALIGYAANSFLELLEARVLRWHKASHSA